MVLHRMVILSVVLLVAGAAACRPHTRERRYRAESGIATRVDGEMVSMMWTHTRTGEQLPLTGRITQDTEIFINGISAAVEDVRPGDRVEVTAYKEEDSNVWVVTRVAVEREESFMLTRSRTLNAAPATEDAP